MANHTVKSGSITLEIKPWVRASTGKKYWRASYYEADGQRRHITRTSLKDAKESAFQKAQSLARGTLDLESLTPHQLRAIRRMLDADPQLDIVDEFLSWRAQAKPEKATAAAVAEFLALKEKNSGLSTQNVRTLRKHLTPFATQFGTASLALITVQQLEAFLNANAANGNRTRRNIRASLVTFCRWCRGSGYLPDGITAAEKTSTPIVAGSIPDTYEPAQLATLLAAVQPQHLPWLAVAAFAGVRTDEISPIAGSKKSPLAWTDFKWDRDMIIIRPETAKTKRRRIVPILPALRAWLWPVKGDSGPIHQGPPPTKRGKGKDAQAETARLGQLIGGWKPNALRHSYISYRAAHVGLGQTAMEAGNSEAEAKASYNDAKGADEADQWFSVLSKALTIPRPDSNHTDSLDSQTLGLPEQGPV